MPSTSEDGSINADAWVSRRSYRDTVMIDSSHGHVTQEEEDEEGNTSGDDVIEEGDNETSFGMAMMSEEKIEAR